MAKPFAPWAGPDRPCRKRGRPAPFKAGPRLRPPEEEKKFARSQVRPQVQNPCLLSR